VYGSLRVYSSEIGMFSLADHRVETMMTEERPGADASSD
jgi:hypothetical protein